MRIDRRGLLAAGAVLAAAGCSGKPQDPMAGTGAGGGGSDRGGSDGGGDGAVTVGLTYIPNVQFCAFYLAAADGLFGSTKVSLRHHGEQEGLFEALRMGREDVVFASADEAVVAGGLATVATAYQRYPAEVMIAGRAPDLGALKGRTLGIPGRFGSSYYAALAALRTAGLSEKDVKLQEIGYTSVSALTTKKVDAIIGFTNNELVQFRAQGFAVSSLPVSSEPTLVGPSLVTTPQLAEDPHVRAVIEGMRTAEERIAADPQRGIEATIDQVPALADPSQREAAQHVLEATIALWKAEDGKVSVDVDQAAMGRMEDFLREADLLQAASDG